MEVCDINLKDYIQSKEKDKAGGLISCFYESNVNEDFAGKEDHAGCYIRGFLYAFS